MIVKELVDNAFDAAESAGVVPRVRIGTEIHGDELRITVADNGPGITPEVLAGVLDFPVLVSDKAAYRSPTRGLQVDPAELREHVTEALAVNQRLAVVGTGRRWRGHRRAAQP